MSVYLKLNNARVAFHNLPLKKNGENKYAGYKYFELGDFLVPALKVFQENGLCAIISFGSAVATMKIVDIETKETIEITSPMAEANLKGCHPIQNLGAVETYTRRYLWVAALEIVEHDAIDSSAAIVEPTNKGKGVISPTKGALDDLDVETQNYIREIALDVVELVVAGKPTEANDRIKSENLEVEQKIALWSLLDSKTRSTLKKEQTKE